MKSMEAKEDRKRCLCVILCILALALCTSTHRISDVIEFSLYQEIGKFRYNGYDVHSRH